MVHITLRSAMEADACKSSYKTFAKHLGGVRAYGKDTPIPLLLVLDVMGLCDALWCLDNAIIESDKAEAERIRRLFSADCAEHVLHNFESVFPDDWRPRQTIEVARRFAVGDATEAELEAARNAAWSAADAIRNAARNAVCDAPWSAADAARNAAWSAPWSAADAARSAAWSAASDAARNAEIAWQAERLRYYLVTQEGG